MKGLAHEWWGYLADMLGITIKADDAAAVRVHLIVAQETAQSLAWIMTDGMPLIIGRTASPFESKTWFAFYATASLRYKERSDRRLFHAAHADSELHT